MNKNITSYKIIATLAILSVITLAVIGFWFAEEKSAPVYRNKIDKLMFEKANKAPRFVLTLPEPEQMKKQKNVIISTEASLETAPTQITSNNSKTIETIEDVMLNIPSLILLKEKQPTQQLKYISLIDELTESVDSMLLPKISAEGKKPWSEYGKSVTVQPNFKKVAVIIKGLGFDTTSLDKIIKSFDSEVSISLSPYTADAGTKQFSARQYGHETYVDMLLSSKNFLKSDNGPMSMSITISQDEALFRLRKSLATGAPVGGVIINDGIADQDNKELLLNILKELKNRGLLMIDATKENGIEDIKIDGLARRKADIVIDEDFSRDNIRRQLQKAEDIAFNNGQVLVVIDPKPIAIIEIYNWINTFSPQVEYEQAKNMELTKPFAVVPVSNLVIE